LSRWSIGEPGMNKIERVDTLEKISAMADSRRLPILQRLMAGPATLSQLGRAFGKHPAWIRHHLKQLEEADLVRMTSTRPVRGFVEKYYQAVARAFSVNIMVMPAGLQDKAVVALGSHDLALDLLTKHFHEDRTTPDMMAFALGSLDGLIALQQGVGHLAGCHLFDGESGEYNRPFARHLFPGQQVVLITLAYRQQGFLLAPGNPRQIHSLEDLAREDVGMINRNKGSGTRLWLDQHLRQCDIVPDRVRGYDWEVNTHTEVAEAVNEGRADVGVGLFAAARLFGLEFIPLFQERYDLVVPREHYDGSLLQPVLDQIHAGKFRRAIEGLGGYETTHTGEEVKVGP